jgi:hypothetical protein
MALALEPNLLRMCDAAIYEHGVAGAGVECCSISLVDGYVRVAREIFFGTIGESWKHRYFNLQTADLELGPRAATRSLGSFSELHHDPG